MNKLTIEQRQQKWEDYKKKRTDFWDQIFEETKNSDCKEFVKLELFGGECHVCGKKWHNRQVCNSRGIGEYFKPSCHCYPVCPECEEPLYDDFISKLIYKNTGYVKIKDESGKEKETIKTLRCWCGALLKYGDKVYYKH